MKLIPCARFHLSMRVLALMGLGICVAIARPANGADDDGPASLVGRPAPELTIKAYGSNRTINLKDYRGKMVVVDFFRAENASDLTGFDDVAEVERDYARKGVVIVGVSMDTNMPPLVNLLQKKPSIDWPIGFEWEGFATGNSQRWKASHKTGDNDFSVLWHVDYLVSPEGTVLWAGLPDLLDRAIEDQIKDHKPQIVDAAVMADATATLNKMTAAIAANNLGEALHQRKRIAAAALDDDDFAAQVKDADDKWQAAGEAALAAVDPLIDSKDYASAAAKLKDLSNGADGTPIGSKAKVKLIELQKNPDAKAALQTAEKNERADDALKVAQKFQDQKKDIQAYTRFKLIVKNFAGTPAAQTATSTIATYDADPDFKKQLAGAAASSASGGAASSQPAPDNAKPDPGRAKSLLSLANSYRDSGNADTARSKYEDVITQFPGTPEADAAKDEIAKLPQ